MVDVAVVSRRAGSGEQQSVQADPPRLMVYLLLGPGSLWNLQGHEIGWCSSRTAIDVDRQAGGLARPLLLSGPMDAPRYS